MDRLGLHHVHQLALRHQLLISWLYRSLHQFLHTFIPPPPVTGVALLALAGAENRKGKGHLQ